ncbi:aminopeptidase N [Kineosporia sp. A_224]|uniref:aminopeptidase N n=1 Tax=Kineosporia sp. A_224 TaxID=1962180 RepID=UPI000B4BE9E5|nr:aminopeptidase N [Kineosporia sp. A_224]
MPGTNLTRDEAAERARLLGVEAYDVTLDLTTGADTYASTTVVTFTCREPGASTFVDLIAPAVREVVLNGQALDVAEVVSTGRIALSELAARNELRVVADAAYMTTGEGLHRFVDPVDKEVYLYTQFEVSDARRVFTCFDQPDLKATYAFTVTAPSHWQVVSNSPTPAPQDLGDGRATWAFAATPRLSTYVTALVAGPYHAERGELTSRDGRTIPLGVLCRASLAEHLDAGDVMDVTREGFAFFEELFDRAYPFDKYDQLFVPEFNAGAMENAGAVTITEQYVFRSKVPEAAVERRALTILHELAHMWFGDLVTMRWWDDLWLNESFAEYASTRCQAEATRWTTAWTTFSSAEKSWAYRQDQLASTHPIVADIRDLADVEVNFDGITYAKGASVLKQLVHWVGTDAFDEGLRRYFRAHEWGNTTLADLLAELEATSGRDLDAWAQEWLQTAGVATLRPHLEVDADGVVTKAVIGQEAPADHPTLRSHRLAVGCYDVVDGRLRRTQRIELDVAGAATEVPQLVGSVRPDLLLVNDDDLAYGKIRLDGRSLDTAIGHLSDFEDSLPRTLVWGAAWDMTRDAETGPRDFVDLVVRNIASVDDASVAQTLLRQLASTLMFYVAPENRSAATASAADALLSLLDGAAPGGDAQLLYARAFAAHATTPEQLARLRALLDGGATVPGLSVDTDMRWTLLTALVAGGVLGEEDVVRELDRDDTASGRVHAAAARAAVPTPEAKAQAWELVVGTGELPNAVQAAVIGGFGRASDTTLLEPYVERYFAALEPVWAERTSEMASQIVVGLYPTVLAGPALLERTEAWLATTQAEPALRRLVVEARDGVTRAVAAHERDRAR